jgi:hypothetical protein
MKYLLLAVFQIVARNKCAPLTHPHFASLVTPPYDAGKGKKGQTPQLPSLRSREG